MPEVSVIVPVYNAEEYLPRCINSIQKQTLTDIEIILINDGSQDNSGRICDEYASRDDRIKVIHQKNAGVSAARNAGMRAAKGRYIGFVDADDWVNPDMYEAMLSSASQNNADIVICDAQTVYSNGKAEQDTIVQLPQSTVLTRDDISPELLKELAGSAWRCIYSDKRLRTCGPEFPLGVKFSEDRAFNIAAMGSANVICYIKKAYYARFVNLKSAVHRYHADYFEAYKKAAECIREQIKKYWADDRQLQIAYLEQFITGAFGAVNNYYYKTSEMTSKERRTAVKALCNDTELRDAIKQTECRDIRAKWILNKNILFLILYAKAANLKHGR